MAREYTKASSKSYTSGIDQNQKRLRKIWEEDEERRLQVEEAKQRELAKQEDLAREKKNKGMNPFEWVGNEIADTFGTAEKKLIGTGAQFVNDVATGFNNDKTESKKRTQDFLKSTGVDKWGEQESLYGDIVGSIIGGSAESSYKSVKNTSKDIRNANIVQDRINAQEDARQALQNWKDRPDLMRKTLKPGETEKQKIKQLTDLTTGKDGEYDRYKEAVKYINERDPLQAAGDAVFNLINLATLGGAGLATNIGTKLAERLPKALEGLGKNNSARQVVGDTLLAGGAAGADAAAKGQEVGPEEIGVGMGLAILTHGRGIVKDRNAAKAEAASTTQRSEFLARREQENAAKLRAMDYAQQQLNANAASQKQLRLTAGTDTAKTDMSKRLAEIDDAELRLASNDPDYLRENNLYDVEGGDKRYKELITEDPANAKARQEASAALREADDQVTYYNNLQAESPYFRQVNRAEAARKKELDQLEEMARDPGVETDQRGVELLAKETNAKYDEKLDALSQKYPEEAAQKPILDQTLEQVTATRMQAEDNLNNLVQSQKDAAFKEGNSIAETPSVEKIKAHQKALKQERADIEARQKQAEEFSQTPNRYESDADKELSMLEDGSHPDAGTPKAAKTRERLLTQKQSFSSDKVMEKDPVKVTRADRMQQRRDALQEAFDEIEVPNNRMPLMLDKLELTPEYLRYRGLEKTADLYEDSVIRVNKENYKDSKMFQEWQKISKSKQNSKERMFDAANGDIEAYNKLTPAGKEVIDKWRAKAKQWGRELGLPEEILDRPYISHIIVDDNKRARLLKLSDELHDVEAKIKSGEGDTANLRRQQGAIMKKMEEQMDFQKENFKTVSGKVKNRFLEKRYGAEGYQRDFWTAVHAYSRAKNTKLYMEEAVHAMAKIANNKADDGLKSWLENRIENVTGGKASVDKKLDNFLSEQVGLPKNIGTGAAVQARRVMSLAKIGYSINSIVNSSMQLATIPGVINADGAVVGFMNTQKLLARLGTGTASEADRALWKKMHEHGIFEGDSQLLPEGAISKVGKIIDTTAFAGIKGADRYIRVVTYMGALHKANKLMESGKLKTQADVDRYAWRMTNKANQNFSKLVAPKAFQSQVSKTLWSMMTFLPGTVVRSGEVTLRGVKGLGTVIGISKITGKEVTKGEYQDAIGDVSKAIFMAASMAGMSQLIGGITGNGDIVPNPFKKDSWQTPFTNFLGVTGNQAGLNYWMKQSNDKLVRNDDGTVSNQSMDERAKQFWTETLPSFIIPGYAQGHRTVQGLNENSKGYGESASGKVQWVNDKNNDFKRAVFGKYSTDEGQAYIKGLETPEGGPLNKDDSATFKNVPTGLRNQYYDFFKSSDTVSGRSDANTEVTQLYREGKVQQARRKAAEYNAKVDRAMSKFYNEYKYIDPDIQEQLSKNLYITLTPSGENRRAKSKDN